MGKIQKIKDFYQKYKFHIGVVVLLTIFFIGFAILFFHNSGLRRSEKEYKKQVKILNDSIQKIDKRYKLNRDTIYIAEAEANKQSEIAKKINQQTNDVRSQIPKEINIVINLNDDSSVVFFTEYTNSYTEYKDSK